MHRFALRLNNLHPNQCEPQHVESFQTFAFKVFYVRYEGTFAVKHYSKEFCFSCIVQDDVCVADRSVCIVLFL